MKDENLTKTIIASTPPDDGQDWEAQCARCGSSLFFEPCEACGGEGFTAPGELHEQDPLWYDEEDIEPCHQCGGQASFPNCASSEDWCESHPLPGREEIEPHTVEWFVITKTPNSAHIESLRFHS